MVKSKQFNHLAPISLIIWKVTHFATTAKLSNWLSSNNRVPIATQPFFEVRTTAFSHSWYPFSCPDAYWPFSQKKESLVMMSKKCLHLYHYLIDIKQSNIGREIKIPLTSTVRVTVYHLYARVPDCPSASTVCPAVTQSKYKSNAILTRLEPLITNMLATRLTDREY